VALALPSPITPVVEQGLYRPAREQNYARISIATPILFQEWEEWEKAVEHEKHLMLGKLDPLPRILAEDGQKVWYAGWLDLDGHVWHRSEEMDRYVATFAVYSKAAKDAHEDYNRIRMNRGLVSYSGHLELVKISKVLRGEEGR
jgi:hypothetical protein